MNQHEDKTNRNDEMADVFGELIHSYTRKQAIEDGVLVDVSAMAKEAGFKFPVAMTRSVYAECVEFPAGVEGQDEKGRLWDILFMLNVEARKASGSEVLFSVRVRNSNKPGSPPLVQLKSICGPNDDATPCITIMYPNED